MKKIIFFVALFSFSLYSKKCISQDTLYSPHFNSKILDSSVFASTVQKDGKIIIAGCFKTYKSYKTSNILRINPDGSLDGSFKVGTGANGAIHSVAIQSDGKIIIAGSFTKINGVGRKGIARLLSDGKLDITFNPVLKGSVSKLLIQKDGKIIVACNLVNADGNRSIQIKKININGTIDIFYNPEIEIMKTLGLTCAYIINVVEQKDNKLLFLGAFYDQNDGGYPVGARVFRLLPTGKVDPDFKIYACKAEEHSYSMKLQSDNKIIVGDVYFLVRLFSNGEVDQSFRQGRHFHTLPPLNYIEDIYVLNDDKIIVRINGVAKGDLIMLDSNGVVNAKFITPLSKIIMRKFIKPVYITNDVMIIYVGYFVSIKEYNVKMKHGLLKLNLNDGSMDEVFNRLE